MTKKDDIIDVSPVSDEALVAVRRTECDLAPQVAEASSLLRLAIEGGAALENIREIRAMLKEAKDEAARDAFYAARSKFKANLPKIVKDKVNPQFQSSYVSKATLINTVIPALSEYGLDHHFEYDQSQPNVIRVGCILSHGDGYSESVWLQAPPDASGSKNLVQQIKSTVTYLEVATFGAVTGVVAEDATCDDDGNASGKGSSKGPITEAQQRKIEQLLKETHAHRKKFLEWVGVAGVEKIPAARYDSIMATLRRKAK